MSSQNFDPIGHFRAGMASGPPWDSIVDFATAKSFCGKRLFPRQMTLLKLMYLETETMTEYDLDVIGNWSQSFKDINHPIGVQPDIWDRIRYLKANNFTHFPHIQMVMGRRASKGILGGIVGAERIAYLYSLGSWQQHFNQVPGQVAEVVVVANSLGQAVTRQFRDIRNTVLNCEYLRQHVVSDKQCVDEDTEILTKRGWLKHADLQEGDETLGLHEDGTVSWTRVNRVSRYPGHHDMVHWKSRGHDSLTTPNHRWLVEWWGNRPENGGMRWTRSDKLGDKANEAVIAGREIVEYPEQKYTDALVELVAWYWTEGHLNKWNGISISQNRRANPEKWASIQAALISCFGEAKDSGSRGREFYVGSKHGKAEQIWRHAPGKDKVLSLDFILSLTKAQLQLFVDTSIAGDGHVYVNNDGKVTQTTIFQKRKESLDIFQIACQLLGKQTTLMRQGDGWRLCIYSRSRVLPFSARKTGKINEVTYDGIVWCPSTETGTWLARRDGTVYFTGNTEFYVRTPGDEQTIEENKLAGISSDREIATIFCKASSSVSTSGRGGTTIAIFYDEMAHMLAGTGSAKTGEEIYDAFQPSLDQFGPAGLTYLASSPFSKIGKFYDLYQQGRITMDEYNAREGKMKISTFAEEAAAQDIDVDTDDLAAIAEPTFLIAQLPSWETYRDWDRSREIQVRPGRTRCFPRWNSPVQFEPKEDGTPDEKVQYRRMRRNPDKFSVERGAQFATVQDAYLNEVMVDRMFAPPGWRPPLEQQHQGILAIRYRAHADPSRTNANFGFCIAHLEDAPPDEYGIVWPHVIIDVLHVWKPEDFPDHTIDYVKVGEELDDYLIRFPSMTKMSYDQFNCQSGDTLISTGYGLLRLDEIVGDIPDRTGIAIDLPVRSKDTDAAAEQGYHKGLVPTRKITTKLGTTLNVTPEHRLWTRKGRDKPWQKDGEWGYAEASEIAVGDWLCVKRNTCMVTDEVDLTVIPGWAESWGVQRHAAEWTPTCDENLAEALGLLVAEGDYRSGTGTGRDHVRFGNSDDEVLERYRMLMEKSFGGTWRSQTTDEWKGKYHYGWVRKAGVVPGFLGRLGLTGTATAKVIPWIIYRSPASVIRSFLRGYFEGDGGVIFGREGEAWVSACSTSKEVATGIQQLLMSVGVFCTLWSGNYRYKGETRPQWRVQMYGQDALDFARLVGFSSTRKRQELADAVEMIEARQGGNIRSKNQRHGDEYWVRITSIEESEADCYEISVPGPESYLANGMVSHNSAGFISHQKKTFPNIRILEKTFTVKENQDRFEKFKSALNLGWVHCFAGETSVLTPEGPRPIRDLAGTTARLLTTSQNDGRGGGKWVDAPVESFGVQALMKVTLRRNGLDKVIYATDRHRWFVRTTNGTASRRDEVLTADLKSGQKLSYCYAQRHKATRPSPIGIAHGFTYGDGTRSRKGAVAQFCGDKDKALIPYFDLHPIVDIGPGIRRALDLPRFFKEKVDLAESPSYLYGWLAGYVAADGTVDKDGYVSISSVDRSSIEHVRTVCNLLGVHATTIATSTTSGGYKPGSHSHVTRIDPTALTEDFFLIEEHRRRWLDNQDKQRKDYRGYTVVSVEETDRVEEVFCAVVEGTHSFTLEDNILTGNSHRDTFAEEGQSLLELELKFLQEKNGKVDKQEIGPVQTKDLADAVMVVTTELLHESLDRWWTAINRTSVGSTNVDGLRAGREQERLMQFDQDRNGGWSTPTTYTDPVQRYLAEEAERGERRALRADRNRSTLERNKAERSRRNAFGAREPYRSDRIRGSR